MRQIKFKCELLTDVIINQKSASEGANRTLDFIPGSNFLGIVASVVYKNKAVDNNTKLKMFHTNDVRFGDAHPANDLNRTLRIPACLYYEKGAEEEGRTHYVHHAIQDLTSEKLRSIQLKQERGGFADFISTPKVRLKVERDFAIKSAYDREFRRSKDAQMFGYQSMGKGMTFLFSVEVADSLPANIDEIIIKGLEGIHHVGRSRSAQYGLVSISKYDDFKETDSFKGTLNAGDFLIIYAESRLIFLDTDNQPTYQPSGEQLTGNKDDKVCWDKSQIRTFQYAPYNYQRRCFDTDRCGIEKGSVIVVKLSQDVDVSLLASHVGSYLNEGFGKVIYNPNFLKADKEGRLLDENKIESKKDSQPEKPTDPQTKLIAFLNKCNAKSKEDYDIYKAVNTWVEDKEKLKIYAKESFASQWGQIRAIAMKCVSRQELEDKLFKEKDNQGKGLPDHQKGYLVHGVAKDKWKDRTDALKAFVQDHSPKAVVNLASEMQKRCK